MSNLENAEIKKQVQELLKKGSSGLVTMWVTNHFGEKERWLVENVH